MLSSEFGPVLSHTSESGAAPKDVLMEQRHQAMLLFLDQPDAAIAQYPQLIDELITFFAQSSNPHLNDRTGVPSDGREADFECWKAAKDWALSHAAGRPGYHG